MKFGSELEKYVEHNVSGVTKIKNKYGYRVRLIYADGSEAVQQKSGYESKAEANKARDKTIGELYSGKYIVYEDIKVEEFLKYWLEEEVRGSGISHDTYKSYSNALYKHIIPAIGKLKLSALKRVHIQKLYLEKINYSAAITRMIKTVLNVSMAEAERKKLITINPAKGVPLPKAKNCTAEKKGYRTRSIDVQKTLTLDQMFLLLEKSEDTPIYMQILFAMLMGLRRGEIYGVKYSDVDYINRTLCVQRQLGIKPNSNREDYDAKTYTKQEIGLKTKSSYRTLDIPDMVFEAILKQRKIYEENRKRRPKDFIDEDYICCSSYGRPRSRSYHSIHYKRLLRENGLPDIRWHDLRSTFCTLLMQNDFSAKAISRLMGHAKEIITMDVYTDNKQMVRDGVKDIQAFIDDVLPPEEDPGVTDLTDVEIEIGAYI